MPSARENVPKRNKALSAAGLSGWGDDDNRVILIDRTAFHSGDVRHSGHFYAIFTYRGLCWLVDDGAYPRVLPSLQENINQQIVQVWAMPSAQLLPTQINCDFPTSSQTRATQEPDAKRRCQPHITFTVAKCH